MNHPNPSEELEHMKLAMEIAGMPDAEIVLPAQRHTRVHGLSIHYLDWGTPGKTPIVFLHGGGLNAHTWDLLCTVLRRDYHCLAPDLRGHGETEWSEELDYGFEAHGRDIAGIVDRLALDKFLLVGMSLGGIASLLYAADHSDRLRGLVIIDTGPDVRPEGGRRISRFVQQTGEADSLEDLVAQALAFNPGRDPRLLRRSLRHNFRQNPDGKWVRKNDMRHWRNPGISERAASLAQYWAVVPRVYCPTLVVRGANSDLFHDADAEKLARALPNGRWARVENAGHTVQGDNPRGLLEALRTFFAEIGV
jgi:pimeloyl-ACP methyl ester carboxylesterase